MAISLVISSLSSGGAERVMSLLANRWAERGEEIYLITLSSAASDCYRLDARVRRVALDAAGESSGPCAALINNCRRILQLRRALQAAGTTVVVSFGDQMNVLVLLAMPWRSIRKIISERTDPAQHPIGALWTVLRRVTYPLAQALVVQTRGLLPWASSIVGQGRAFVIPNPVRSIEYFEAARGVDRSQIILGVGRLVPAKGFDVLVRAFASISAEFPRATLVIAGEGPERDALTALAQELGIAERLALPGWVPEPAELMAKATIFVLSSRYEGFPNVLLEAMACGLPVITTACAGPREIVSHDIDGLLVQIGSVSEMAAAIRRLLGDERLRASLQRKAAAIRARYSMDAVMASWEAIVVDASDQKLPASGIRE